MKVEILSKEFIKPTTPTPPCHNKYKLNLLDELAPIMSIPVILYYPAPNASPHNETSLYLSKCKHLKNSLAKTLTKFYPLAGRFTKDSYIVDCSDQGAALIQAHVDIQLNDVLNQVPTTLEVEELNSLLPITSIVAADDVSDPLLSIQVNTFECGGLAIALCMSHRLADMSTLGLFIKEWATNHASQVVDGDEGVEYYHPISPLFNPPLFLPGGRGLTGLFSGSNDDNNHGSINNNNNNVVTKMIRFHKAMIARIRAKSKSQHSKVQLVFGVILKALVDINVAKDVVALEVVNIRERTIPPLSKYAFGNFCTLGVANYLANDQIDNVHDFVDRLDKCVKSAVNLCAEFLVHGEEGQMMLINGFVDLIKACSNKEISNAYLLTSWCNFPFYEADFGWGNPIWVSAANFPLPNTVMLIDGKEGDGIEAWITLEDKDMLEFEKCLKFTNF